MEINWTEPPPQQRNNVSRIQLIDALKKNPGKWVLYKTKNYASAGYTFRKMHPNLEITTRAAGKNENGTPLYDIYVRYVEGETNNA